MAVCLDSQDFSQLTRDYGDKVSKEIQNTVGNVFSGQVVGETAKTLSERFGKVLQLRQSMIINRNNKSTSISTQMDSLIPTSKISNLTQDMFVVQFLTTLMRGLSRRFSKQRLGWTQPRPPLE